VEMERQRPLCLLDPFTGIALLEHYLKSGGHESQRAGVQ
jgi:hypothetical protein